MTTNNNNQAETNTNTFKEDQSVWVRGRIASGVIHIDGDVGVIMQSTDNKNSLYYCLVSEIRTTEQICDEQNTRLASQNKTDITRKLEKGDNVRIVEYDGRIPSLETFMVGDIYTVASEEDVYGDVYLFDEISGRHEIVPWIFLELVELARKYKLFEKKGEYQIYDTQQGVTKASFSKEIYTFEEVQAECDRLNKRQETNENA